MSLITPLKLLERLPQDRVLVSDLGKDILAEDQDHWSLLLDGRNKNIASGFHPIFPATLTRNHQWPAPASMLNFALVSAVRPSRRRS